MTGKEYANYLKGIEKRKDDALCKVANTYCDEKKNLWDEFTKSFPIKKGDNIKVRKKNYKVTKVDFFSHSCLKTPLPVFRTEDGTFMIKDIEEHNNKPFHHENWTVEKN